MADSCHYMMEENVPLDISLPLVHLCVQGLVVTTDSELSCNEMTFTVSWDKPEVETYIERYCGSGF